MNVDVSQEGTEGLCKAALTESLQLTGSGVGAARVQLGGAVDLRVIHESSFQGVSLNAGNGLR